MTWIIESTESFSKTLKKQNKNKELLNALDAKIKRLEQNPISIGGKLCGSFHCQQSTRLVRKFRLIFQVDEVKHTVYLIAIDHRKDVYE